jgi:hypothetical protein
MVSPDGSGATVDVDACCAFAPTFLIPVLTDDHPTMADY